MNAKLLRWAILSCLLGAIAPGLHAQQTPSDQPEQSNPSTVSNPPTIRPRDPREERARVLMAEKQYEGAMQVYQDLLKSQPKNAIYMNMIGIAYLNMSNFGQAKKYFDRSAKTDKKYPSPVNNLGMVWYQQKNYGRAIREYQRAVKIDPDQAGTHANLAFAFYRTKKYAEAAAEFHKALEIDPHALDHSERVGTMAQDRTVENHGLFFYMMAREYAQMGDAARCADFLHKAFDEGYKDVAKAKTDPDFKKVINDPAVQAVLSLLTPGEQKVAATPPGA